MDVNFTQAAKAKQLKQFFQQHGRIYIVVNATSDDVVVPEHLHGDPALRLVLNVRMPQPVRMHDEVLESKFTFHGTPFSCRIPMHTIWAAYLPDQHLDTGIMWENDMPETIKSIINAVRSQQDEPEAVEKVETEAPQTPASVKRRHLRVVK
jgi:stringent starvation protein B